MEAEHTGWEMVNVNLMRSAIRILIATCFLLFVAWLGMKLMQFGGNWERLFQEAQQKAAPFIENISSFYNEQILPRIEELVRTVQSFAGTKR